MIRPAHTAIMLSLVCITLTAPSIAQVENRLPNGKYVTPAGEPTNVGSFPANMIATPDHKYVIVTNTGYRQYLSVLQSATGKLVSRIEITGKGDTVRKRGLYYGLAIQSNANGGYTLYASRGSEDAISIHSIDPAGKISVESSVIHDTPPASQEKFKSNPAGISLDSTQSIMYVCSRQRNKSGNKYVRRPQHY